MRFSDFSVRTYGQARGGHSHDHVQVLWPLQGCLEMEVEGKGVALQVGDALLVRPGERHEFESREGSRCLVLDTNEPAWQRRSERPVHAKSVSQLAAFLAVALEEKPPLALESGKQLLAQCWGDWANPAKPRRTIDWRRLTYWATRRLGHDLQAADLADQVHLGESQFRARCVEEMGVAPMQWVRQLRLSKALQLREAGVKVAEICQRVGYESPSALAVALRRTKMR